MDADWLCFRSLDLTPKAFAKKGTKFEEGLFFRHTI
jgi:hypothetical protein